MSNENMVPIVPTIEAELLVANLVPFSGLLNAVTTGPGNIRQNAGGSWDAYGTGPNTGTTGIYSPDVARLRYTLTVTTGRFYMLALSNDVYPGTGFTYLHLDFAIYQNGTDNLLRVYENGVKKWGGVAGELLPFQVGDVCEILVEKQVVRYAANGRVFYQSAATPTFPLRVQFAGSSVGAEVDDATVLKRKWVDLSDDVVSEVRAEWGIRGNSPNDRVADVGSLGFTLDNQQNKYATGHPSALEGWGVATPVRLKLTHPLYGTVERWTGTVERLTPGPSQLDPRVGVTCADWMEEAGRAKPSNLEVLLDTQSDAVFQALVDAIEKPPPGGTVKIAGSDVYPFALDQVKDEQTFITSEFQRLAQSEFGYVYVQNGAAVFEGRRRRGVTGVTQWDLDDSVIVEAQTTEEREDVRNRVQTLIHPRRRDAAATTVIFGIQNAIAIPRGTSITVNGPFRDPLNPDKRIGATNVISPAGGTDFLFNTQEDGTGQDITGQVTVTPTTPIGGNSVELTASNAGPLDGWLIKLETRGRGLYDFEPLVNERRDTDSIRELGENAFAFDMPYQNRIENGADVAEFILSQEADPRTRLEAVTFLANWDDTVAQQFYLRAISDRIGITLPVLGLSAAQFFVNGIRLAISSAGLVRVTYFLAPAAVEEFWLLGIAGRSELQETTRLGYGLFVAGWVLGTSQLGTDTFAN
jgi:hypothetical protein